MAFGDAIRGKLAGLKNRKASLASSAPTIMAPPLAAAPPSPFLYSFKQGMIGGAGLFLILILWMWLRTGDTAEKIQPLLEHQIVALSSPEEKEPEDLNSRENTPEAEKLVAGRAVEPLPPAPIEGFFETVDGKILPRIRFEDDSTPFDAYKRPHKAVAGRPQISIVIVDYGLNGTSSQALLDSLPPEITFALSPYAAEASKWAGAARAYGHEFWVSLPMKGDNPAIDAGPDAIDPKASLEDNTNRTIDILSTAAGYAGIVTMKNHGITAGDLSPHAALKQIYGRGLALAESNPDISAWGLTEALEAAYPYVQNNFWIDEALTPSSIDAALRAVELQATRKGKAVAFLHPTPLGIKKIQEWTAQAEANGFQLAPLSFMVAQ